MIQTKLKEIGSPKLSDDDRSKIRNLNQSYLEQLSDYGFSSYPVDEISVSEVTYRPMVDNFELGLTSASDAIRNVWAYLLGILEVAGVRPDTNHIGFVIFDEPKQQSTADLSFAALLKRAAKCKARGQQVIFATSEKRERLDQMLHGLDCSLHWYGEKMLTPVVAKP